MVTRNCDGREAGAWAALKGLKGTWNEPGTYSPIL